MLFLDTNIFLYAVGGPHPLRGSCAKVLRDVGTGSLDATTNAEVIQEILYVLARRGARNQACELARRVALLFPDLLPIGRQELLVSCELIDRYPRLSVRDSIHAASMLNNRIKDIMSLDTDFDLIAGIRRVPPA